MSLTIHKDSHLDHAIGETLKHWLLGRFADKDGFFIETIEIPAHLGTVPCALFGPIMGDQPIPENHVVYSPRGDRGYNSRICPDRASRWVNTLTVIAGPHDGQNCVLYTAFGGPLAPKEPGDASLKEEERADSEAFWSTHALGVNP